MTAHFYEILLKDFSGVLRQGDIPLTIRRDVL